jgi:hypothetical protein
MKPTRKTIVGVDVSPADIGLASRLFDMQAHLLVPAPATFTGEDRLISTAIRGRQEF